MKKYIKGNYRRSIFESDKGYVIGLFKVSDTNMENMEDYIGKTITFTGYFHELNLDDSYVFYGEELEHPKYGFQFQVSEYERLKPSGKDGIVAFLSSDLFHGIGEKMAERIVDTLGEQALDRILEEPESLMLVPKLSKKKMDHIVKTLQKYEESHQTIVYLTDLGFSMKDSLNIYNYYKSNTIPTIEHNIYRLLDDVDEISFPKLDEISMKLGYDCMEDSRIESCIIYIMEQLSFKQGDTYLYQEEVIKQLNRYLKIEITLEQFTNHLHNLRLLDKVVVEENKLYLKEMYEAEKNIAYELSSLTQKKPFDYPKLTTYLETLQKENDIIYNEKQKEAIVTALTNSITIITGGPGTGKSATSLVVK